ncbi:hypothetical protein Q5752_006407 [Cryptotrichosporon argae]
MLKNLYRPPVVAALVLLVIAWQCVVVVQPSWRDAAVHTLLGKAAGADPHTSFDPAAHHVFIATLQPWHEAFWLWLAGSIEHLGVNTTLFTECNGRDRQHTCIRFGLLEFAQEIGLWDGELRQRDDIFASVNQPLPNGRYADVVLLPTDYDDFRWAGDRLLDLWHARPGDQKFKLVVTYHHPSQNMPHIANVNRDLLNKLTLEASTFEHAEAGIEHIKSYVINPTFDIGDKAHRPLPGHVPREQHTALTQVVIAGMLSPERRAYTRIFNDLEAIFKTNADMFGYRFDGDAYVALDADDPSTFKLVLLGEKDPGNALPNPDILRNVVEIRNNVGEDELYATMASTDLIITAWNSAYRYLDSQASSTMFTTLDVEVPLMTTQTVLDRYEFLDRSIAVVKPHALTDMAAVALFRRFAHVDFAVLSHAEIVDLVAPLYTDPPHAHFIHEVATMLQEGWSRPQSSWAVKKAVIRANNARSLQAMIQG